MSTVARIEHGVVIGERNVPEHHLRCFLYRSLPTAVLALHRENPVQRALGHGVQVPPAGIIDLVQRQQNLRGLVHVRIKLVIEFQRHQRPAPGSATFTAQSPFVPHSFDSIQSAAFNSRRIGARTPCPRQREHRLCRIPYGRHARLQRNVGVGYSAACRSVRRCPAFQAHQRHHCALLQRQPSMESSASSSIPTWRKTSSAHCSSPSFSSIHFWASSTRIAPVDEYDALRQCAMRSSSRKKFRQPQSASCHRGRRFAFALPPTNSSSIPVSQESS